MSATTRRDGPDLPFAVARARGCDRAPLEAPQAHPAIFINEQATQEITS